MAQIVLTAASNAAASHFGLNSFTSFALKTGSQFIGQAIDNAVFGSGNRVIPVGRRLEDLAVQSSAYGQMIPIIYGTSRVAGNVIWSRPINEEVVTTDQGGGKGGGGGGVSTESYLYSVSLGIAICEGEIDDIVRVWADTKIIDPSFGEYRLYKGTEDQLVDPFIESFEGINSTPAYRGIAYVVIEDFPLEDYGNRIPNFLFEVVRKARLEDETDAVEHLINSMVMIPGSGEFVYDTVVQTKQQGQDIGGQWAQQGSATLINQNNRSNKADALVALDQMAADCPNVEWVSVVVGWFGDDLDAANCLILPGVEFDNINTIPDSWAVGTFNRGNAYQISQDGDGNPVYGGTISDDSLLRYLDELADRGYNVMFYPLFFMDTANKPWRGRLTGSAADVASFFTKTNGYNAYITHYANLVKDKVGAFIIGSELIGLTSVQAADDSFPAVDALVSLASTVKGIVGSGVKVSYAADWSEYHHTNGGWYHLDPLLASSSIDFIGIDAYFPLTDAPQDRSYEVQPLIDGWTSGEGYDWVYTDANRTIKDHSLQAAYAWKNIDWWWRNNHVNPDMTSTAWVPESKKIWFTEYGFPSVDGASNQPNVFYDPNSSESAFPYHSKGRVDLRAQRVAIEATEKQWAGSSMIERLFLWTWDARPYPFWPQLQEVWSDYGLWEFGHWVQGKIATSSLKAIVADLCEKGGLTSSQYDVSRLTALVDGYVINTQDSVTRSIELLQLAYFFDAVETDGILHFIPRETQSSLITIAEEKLLPLDTGRGSETRSNLSIEREYEVNLPQKIDVNYINRLRDFQVGNQHAQRLVTQARDQQQVNLAIIMSDQQAKHIADVLLFTRWVERQRFRLQLGTEYLYLEPGDVITVAIAGFMHQLRIQTIRMTAINRFEIEGVAQDSSVYDIHYQGGNAVIDSSNITVNAIPDTELFIVDIPSLPTDPVEQGVIRYGAGGLAQGWRGSVLYRSDDNGTSYQQTEQLNIPAIMGTAITVLANGVQNIFDNSQTVNIVIRSGSLSSASTLAVLNGANLALLGEELIQFTTASLVGNYEYQLSGLLRGRFNTESFMSSHIAGERFILLDNRLEKDTPLLATRTQSRLYKAVTVGGTLGATAAESFTWQAKNLQPYSPVHIRGSRDAGGNLLIDWIRRARVNGQLMDGVEVALDEISEAYEVDIMDGETVIRTISSNTQNTSYSASDQTNDWGGVQSSISVRIYQISSLVGRGKVGNAVL